MSDRDNLKKFFQGATQDARSAAQIVVRESGQMLKTELKKQLKANFRKGNDSRGFFQAISIYDYTKPENAKPTVYVRPAIGFMHVFEAGDVISAKRSNLIYRLPDGVRLGLPRVSKRYPWASIYARFGKQFKILKAKNGNGWVVVATVNGASYAVYKIQPRVKLSKRLDLYAAAKKIGDTMQTRLEKLLNNI